MVFLLQLSLSFVPLLYTRITKKTKNKKKYNNTHKHTHTACLIAFTRASCVTHLIPVIVFLLKCYNIPHETICLRLLEFRI